MTSGVNHTSQRVYCRLATNDATKSNNNKKKVQSRLIFLLLDNHLVPSFCLRHISVLHYQISADDAEGSHRRATSDIVSLCTNSKFLVLATCSIASLIFISLKCLHFPQCASENKCLLFLYFFCFSLCSIWVYSCFPPWRNYSADPAVLVFSACRLDMILVISISNLNT